MRNGVDYKQICVSGGLVSYIKTYEYKEGRIPRNIGEWKMGGSSTGEGSWSLRVLIV